MGFVTLSAFSCSECSAQQMSCGGGCPGPIEAGRRAVFSRCGPGYQSRRRHEGNRAVTWLPLQEATALIEHDVQKAQERLERAISKAWQVRAGGEPQLMPDDPNVPLRIPPSSGLRLEGRTWLETPVLHWEASEIECLCKPWAPSSQVLPSAPPTQTRARIEVWGENLVRLWGGDRE